MKHLLALMLTAIATGQQWHVQWNPQSDQVSIVTVTKCLEDGKQVFYVWDEFPLVEIGQDEADIHKQLTPRGKRCTVQISVMVSGDEGLHIAQSPETTIVVQED